ncbi:4-alpha-glucanotransferase, partial [Streptomyces hundungensis]
MSLARLAARHGVAMSYSPSPGLTVTVPEATVVAVLAALGVDASTPAAVHRALADAEAADLTRLLPPTLVRRGDGSVPGLGDELTVIGTPVAQLPLGVHQLDVRHRDGRTASATLMLAGLFAGLQVATSPWCTRPAPTPDRPSARDAPARRAGGP